MPLMNFWEELFYELPCWKVIHFIWMIAWRWESLIGNEIPYAYHYSYLEEAIEKQEGFHIDLPLSHNEGYWVYPPKANFHIWEEPLGDKIIVEYSKQWWKLLMRRQQEEEGRNFSLLIHLLEDKQHFGGEDCNIPKI